MLKKLTLTHLVLIFFLNSTNLFSIENKVLEKIEDDIITTIDVENESKYLLILNCDIYEWDAIGRVRCQSVK